MPGKFWEILESLENPTVFVLGGAGQIGIPGCKTEERRLRKALFFLCHVSTRKKIDDCAGPFFIRSDRVYYGYFNPETTVPFF